MRLSTRVQGGSRLKESSGYPASRYSAYVTASAHPAELSEVGHEKDAGGLVGGAEPSLRRKACNGGGGAGGAGGDSGGNRRVRQRCEAEEAKGGVAGLRGGNPSGATVERAAELMVAIRGTRVEKPAVCATHDLCGSSGSGGGGGGRIAAEAGGVRLSRAETEGGGAVAQRQASGLAAAAVELD